jgi:hypothetical protein
MATRSTGVIWRFRRAWLLLAIVAGVGLSCDRAVSEQHIDTAPATSRELFNANLAGHPLSHLPFGEILGNSA